MCGIAGIINIRGESGVFGKDIAAMNNAASHRGPDGEGYVFGNVDQATFATDPYYNGINNSFAFAHKRLSIIDLSEAGTQPMSSSDNKHWITYNGEIYNYIELKEELSKKGHIFRTNTDTEVILASYKEWGKECLKHFNGMWAFAILDLNKKTVFCSIDRFGIKPFYYSFDGEHFIFASEIKQILTTKVNSELDNGVIYDYLAHAMLDHSHRTFYKNIKKLTAGTYVEVPLKDNKDWSPKFIKYWDIDLSQKHSRLSKVEYVDKFRELLMDSINLRLRSDVPIGSCLSGGLDSSGIVCIATQILGTSEDKPQQHTFSSCFTDKRFDEREYIEEVIKKTGANSVYCFPDISSSDSELDAVLRHQGEPILSTSVYAQWQVFKSARSAGVTVMLDGQGADELLAGYRGYYGSFLLGLLKNLKVFTLTAHLFCYSSSHTAGLKGALRSMAAASPTGPFRVNRLKKMAQGIEWLNDDFINTFKDDSPYYEHLLMFSAQGTPLDKKLKEMLLHTNLPALLRYEDRNSMAHSIEARVPFLDYRLVEHTLKTPDNMKINKYFTKYLYRLAMKDIIPNRVLERTDKMGFVTPERQWLGEGLKPTLKKTFDSIPDNDNIFNGKRILNYYDKYCNGSGEDTTPWRIFNLIKFREGAL